MSFRPQEEVRRFVVPFIISNRNISQLLPSFWEEKATQLLSGEGKGFSLGIIVGETG